jgi:hypothetical protein
MEEKKQKRIFKKTRGGAELSEVEVQAIRAGRKKLKLEMRAKGIYSKEEFELTASSLGLYFDKNWVLPLWWFKGKGLGLLLGALALLMASLFLLSLVSQMRGHFTINLSDKMFREGFTLSETSDFKNATTHLFAQPAVDVPCISMRQIPADINTGDGQKNGSFFAYTFYIRNAGESTAGYEWEIELNSESRELSKAAWVMVFEEDEMTVYARARADGSQEALPAMDDDTRGYPDMPLFDSLKDPGQYQLFRQQGNRNYHRVIPQNFQSDTIVTGGIRTDMIPMETHRYTIVIWLEGDDPDCTDALIDGHLGFSFNARLLEEQEDLEEENSFFDKLIFEED